MRDTEGSGVFAISSACCQRRRGGNLTERQVEIRTADGTADADAESVLPHGEATAFRTGLKFGDENFTKRMTELLSPLTPEAIERDAGSYVDFLAQHDAVKKARFGAVGLCVSGATVLRMAAAQSYRQGDFNCCGGGAQSKVTARDIPSGIEIRVQGAYYWSVPSVGLNGDQLLIHTYCGPGGWPQPGCNVRAIVIAHYRY
jgi:hypothetical protein